MSGITLATLLGRLSAAVPAVDGVPSATQYQQCIEDAVADLSRRKPLQKLTTLRIVAGTADYTLPTDFIRLASLEGVSKDAGGVMVTSAGLIDFGAAFTETYTVHGQTLTFSPTPEYTTDRRLWYAAAHALDSQSSYPELTPEDARLMLLLAQAYAWEMRAAALVAAAYSFTIGQWSENHGPQVKLLQDQAASLQKRYEDAVRQTVGPQGARGRGNVWNPRRAWEELL